MWLMKTKMLPWLYWNRMIKGLPHESRYLKPFAPRFTRFGSTTANQRRNPTPRLRQQDTAEIRLEPCGRGHSLHGQLI